jgi:hypothetical protein
MDRTQVTSRDLERPDEYSQAPLADPDLVGGDEDQAAGSEGAGRLIGLGESRRDCGRPNEPTRMPD